MKILPGASTRWLPELKWGLVALIFVPIVLAYQGWTYYMFRERVSTQAESLVY